METIQQDLKFNNRSPNEAINVAQDRPLWRCLCLALRTPHVACQKWMNDTNLAKKQRVFMLYKSGLDALTIEMIKM